MLKRIIHHCMIYHINAHVEIQDVIGDALHVEQDTIMGIKYSNFLHNENIILQLTYVVLFDLHYLHVPLILQFI